MSMIILEIEFKALQEEEVKLPSIGQCSKKGLYSPY